MDGNLYANVTRDGRRCCDNVLFKVQKLLRTLWQINFVLEIQLASIVLRSAIEASA